MLSVLRHPVLSCRRPTRADRIAYAGITRIRFNGRRRAAALSARSVRAPVTRTHGRACDRALRLRSGSRAHHPRLVLEQRALRLDAAGVARERAVGADDPVA